MISRAWYVSHHSIALIAAGMPGGTWPPWRPRSVAWIVATSGRSHSDFRVSPAQATSQSCAWTTSGRQSPSRAASATSWWLADAIRATRSPSGSHGSSALARSTRTPSTTSSSGTGDDPCSLPLQREHDDVVTGPSHRTSEAVDVGGDAADHERRVLPRQHQHAHRPKLVILSGALCVVERRDTSTRFCVRSTDARRHVAVTHARGGGTPTHPLRTVEHMIDPNEIVDGEVTDLFRELEVARRRREVEMALLVGEVERRNLYELDGSRNVESWCRAIPRWSRAGGEARASRRAICCAIMPTSCRSRRRCPCRCRTCARSPGPLRTRAAGARSAMRSRRSCTGATRWTTTDSPRSCTIGSAAPTQTATEVTMTTRTKAGGSPWSRPTRAA